MSLNNFQLSGRNALITGAAGLLGRQHAIALVECGAKVILTDLDQKALEIVRQEIKEQFPNGKVSTCVMDVTSEASVLSVLSELKSKEEFIGILINNAAIDAKVQEKEGVTNTSRLEVFNTSEWNRQIAVGLTGAFICSKVFGYEMSRKGGGVILNVASDLAVIAPDQRLYSDDKTEERFRATKPVSYSVIKHGLIGLTKYLATYWPEKNVRCNALSPGGIYNNQGDVFLERVSQLIPLKRMANVDEYKSSVQFLCSDASSYMTGQNLIIDGGRSVW